MQRLTTVWLQGDDAPGAGQPSPAASGSRSVHRYRVEGSAGDHLLWIEAHAGQDIDWPELATTRPTCEVFSFDLARDVGARLTSPAPWLYIVHTDIPADVVDDYNAWYDEEHLPRLVGVPGVERARRYVADGNLSPRYLTAYDLSIKDAFESPADAFPLQKHETEDVRSATITAAHPGSAPRAGISLWCESGGALPPPERGRERAASACLTSSKRLPWRPWRSP
jgi:hypothetical protein